VFLNKLVGIFIFIFSLHYDPQELNQFEHVESEWPLFFTYLILDGLFRKDVAQVEYYRKKLKSLLVDSSLLDSMDDSKYKVSFAAQSPSNMKRNIQFVIYR
jgi:cobalamin biosynthesis Co2+ chelatase CbiK